MHPRRRALTLAVVVAALAGCGVGTGGVEDGGDPPTGLAPGPTLYLVDDAGRLRPDQRDTGRLGTVLGAVQLLLADADPADPALHNEVPETATRAVVEDTGDDVTIYLPLRGADLSAVAVDQVICTAAGVVAASGRDAGAVTITVHPTHGGPVTRACPVLG
ncbi:hypothetical protein ACFQHV_09570 [Promicromonospora thailandica]|uniref:Sporulation and spore germination n=1 Tax=Promicromonospora thailandica TaxID=765201 RepID=A0A9X2G302_9MICO|nr:hypothetical protein [Promicromonospora thailandica]MCP2264728.1 Sporulation and spore germination [Promicromonospora thailandica]BFF19032.1 hypothetical protein GCM10025730_25530 [Promicromonospora thailandica]